MVCQPFQVQHDIADQPGARTSVDCADASGRDRVRIDRTFIGLERLTVAGAAVDVVHVKLHSTLSGRTRGVADDELWVLGDSGLVVKWVRSVDTDADSAFGRVRYRETAPFVLELLTPAR